MPKQRLKIFGVPSQDDKQKDAHGSSDDSRAELKQVVTDAGHQLVQKDYTRDW